jgi:hypothetical protein
LHPLESAALSRRTWKAEICRVFGRKCGIMHGNFGLPRDVVACQQYLAS